MSDLEIPLGKRTKFYRFFEMFPAILSYTIIAMPIILSMISPLFGAVFVIFFIISWFVKAIAMWIRSIQGYRTLESARKINWEKRLSDLEDPEEALNNWHYSAKSWRINIHKANLKNLLKRKKFQKPSNIRHAIIMAVYNEGRDTLEPTIKSVLKSSFDMKNVFFTIAYEERGGLEVEKLVLDLQKKYKDNFAGFYVFKHPKDLPDEVVGKGGNITFAGKSLWKKLKKIGIDADDIIVTTLDSDNRPHETYLAYSAYEYIVSPNSRRISLQPLSLYLNNIWDVPAPMRVLATGNSFWNIVVSQRPHMLRNFASHSQGMAALLDMNFWSTRTIVEDGHQFWRSYFCYDSQYTVVPIYVPIYQDAVMTDKYTRTLKAQFVQLRRWAYGVSDIPYVAERVFTKKRGKMPFWDAFMKFIRLVDSHVSWATAPFILLLGAFAPLFFSAAPSRSIIAHQLPSTASLIQTIAMLGILINIVLSFRMMPPRPKRYKWHRNINMTVQWVLAPMLGIVYGAAAAIYSQTRLFLGRYLDKFDVTEKVVVKESLGK